MDATRGDPVIVALLVKFVLTVLLVGGGVVQIIFGYKLFKSKVGTQPTVSIFKVGGIELYATSVGAVVMMCAAVWAWAALIAAPNYSSNDHGVTVHSFAEGVGAATTLPELQARVEGKNLQSALQDSQQVKRWFANAYAESGENRKFFLIGDSSATLDTNEFFSEKAPNGQLQVTGKMRSGSKEAAVTFKPAVQGNDLIFSPTTVGKTRIATAVQQAKPNS